MAPPGFLCQSDNNHGPLGSVSGLRKSAQIFGWTLRSGRCSPVVVSCRAGAFQASHRFPRFVKSCGIHRWKQFQDERLSIIRIIGNNHFRFTSSFIPSITPACPTCPTPYLAMRVYATILCVDGPGLRRGCAHGHRSWPIRDIPIFLPVHIAT